MRTAAQATAESLAVADEGDGPEDMIVEVEEGAAKVLRSETGEAGEAGEAAGEAGGEAAEAGATSDRSDLLGMCLEEGGALVVLRAHSLQVFARGPGGGARPAAGGGGTAVPATPEATVRPHVESRMAPTRPQQRQRMPRAAPKVRPASANQPRGPHECWPATPGLLSAYRRGRRRCRRRWQLSRPTRTGDEDW